MNIKANENIIKIKREYERIISANRLPINVSRDIEVDEIFGSIYSFNFLEQRENTECHFDLQVDEEKNDSLCINIYVNMNNKQDFLQYIFIATIMVFEKVNFPTANAYASKILQTICRNETKAIKFDYNSYIVMNCHGLTEDYGIYNKEIQINPLYEDFNEDDYIAWDKKLYENRMLFHVSIRGTVIYIDTTESIVHKLSVIDENGDSYRIYFSPGKFLGRFEIGKLYHFYGTVASFEPPFVGGIRIDYVREQEKNSNHRQTSNISTMDGREFELFTKELLQANGFMNIQVTQAASDFGVDVLAQKEGVKYAIQCKRYNEPVGIKAVQEIVSAKVLHNCHVAVVLTNSTFTNSAITLADANGVLLWDYKKLEEMKGKLLN